MVGAASAGLEAIHAQIERHPPTAELQRTELEWAKKNVDLCRIVGRKHPHGTEVRSFSAILHQLDASLKSQDKSPSIEMSYRKKQDGITEGGGNRSWAQPGLYAELKQIRDTFGRIRNFSGLVSGSTATDQFKQRLSVKSRKENDILWR